LTLLTDSVDLLRKGISLVSRRARDIGAIVLMAMVLLVVVDVTLRRAFNSPLPFSFELIGIMLVVVVFCFVAYSTATGRHVSIDVLVARFSPKVRSRTDLCTDFLSAVLFGLIGWQSIVQGIHIWDAGVETGILNIPHYPFLFIVAFGSIVASLAVFFTIINYMVRAVRK